jgi:hypothetical protein
MTNLTFDECACRNTRAKLDSFIDDELLVETNLEIARHFQACGACAHEVAARRELRGRLRAAARAVPAPAGLELRVRATLRAEGRSGKTPWSLMAIAAAVVLCLGSWFTYERSILRVGVGDHVHCAVIRQGSLKPVGQDKFSAQYKPVLAIARQHVPPGMYLTVAHECTFEGRKFLHVTFRDDHRLLSVIMTRRGEWERLPGEFHTGKVKGFQTAAFDTGSFLVYTVSDLSKQDNLRILTAMAPAIRNVLHNGNRV